MPAPYTVIPKAMEPMTCDVYETHKGKDRCLLTVWNLPASPPNKGVYAKQVATRIAALLNNAEYPIGD